MTLIIGEAGKQPDLPNLADPLVNPHGVDAAGLMEYPQHYWLLVLKHGRAMFGLASLVLAVNGALNHLGEIGRRHGTQKVMVRPLDALQGSFVHLFQELCKIHSWTADDIKALQAEIVKVQAKQNAPKILAADGSGRTLN